jgi:PAS domain S-box-containing protein
VGAGVGESSERTRPRLLTRVRQLFVVLVGVVLLVQVIELVDARTAWWPHRAVAALALVTAGAWALALGRSRRSNLLLDLLPGPLLLATGVGLGRHGAILALLIGISQYRALFGARRSVVLGVGLMLAGYLGVGVALSGPTHLFHLGNLVVVVGISGIVAVIRMVAETLAWHDVTSAWDAVLNDAGVELIAAADAATIDAVVEAGEQAIVERTPAAAGGLWRHPRPDTSDAGAGRRIGQPPSGPRGRAADLRAALQRLQTEGALARERVESERRFRLLAERSRDGIYLLELGPSPAYRYLNPAAEEIVGLDRSTVEADARTALARVHPDDLGLIGEARTTQGVLATPLRVRVCRDDGTTVWVEVAEEVVAWQDGEPHLVQGVVHDVTRHRQQELAMERALQQEQAAADELRHIDQMKSTFLQAVSHELRTPLTAVIGSAETLRDRRDELSPEQVDVLTVAVARQASRLGRLLEDLLDVDRLSRGRVQADRAPTPLQTIVGRALEGLGDELVRIDTSIDPVTVDVDAVQVERIVENLLRNAIKHTPPGTRIRLAGSQQAGATVLTVEDDGPGIPPALRRSVFEPFSQGPQAGDAASPGTGIGLALVQRLAELHGGETWVEEATSGGARFVVVLPGAAQQASVDGEPTGAGRGSLDDQRREDAGAPVTAS